MMSCDRAVELCVKAMECRHISPFIVNNVLRCKNVDVSPVERFLWDSDDMVRMFAVKVIGEKSKDLSVLIEVAKHEENKEILVRILRYVSRQKESLQELADLLHSEDRVLREEAIQIFRKAHCAECLFPLLFEDDDRLVKQIKRYIQEQG